MESIWRKIVIFWIYYPIIVTSISIDSLYLDLIHRNLSDFTSFNKFYKDFLKDVRHHRIIDIVSSPINVEKIRSENYDEVYLKNSCYETASDLLYAHGYNITDLKLSTNDIQSLLPAILNIVKNPGCERRLPPIKQHPFFYGWIIGLAFVVIMKIIHLIIFYIAGDHSSALTSSGISRTIANHVENTQNSSDEISFPPIKYHLWLGLGFNAFTCGIILGTVIYHLIPHIYGIPDEDFDYIYLLRGTVILFGIFLFFIVEKLLRFRFKVDEMQFDETNNDPNGTQKQSDASMIQMAKMHGTFHVHERDHGHHKHPESPIRLSPNVDSGDEETNLQADTEHVKVERHSSHHHDQNDLKQQRRNLILYHIIYDLSNDIIYGCGLATAVAHDHLIGSVLWIMIFSEGFRRHSQVLSSLGQKYGFVLLFTSTISLLLGYIIGGILIQITQQWNINIIYIRKEYIYSIVYGALFYTALVTLVPELNDFGQHLQTAVKTADQTSKQRHLLKALILICQNLFLIIGVLIALVLAIIWRYYHRLNIYEYVCKRDSSLLTIDNDLIRIEENILYSYLKTQSNFTLFYDKILQSNDIDDIKRIHRIITQDDIQKFTDDVVEFNLEHKCFRTSYDLLHAFNIATDNDNGSLSHTDIHRLLPALVHVKFNDGCTKAGGRATWKNILIGMIMVTFINCSALCGAIILPFRKKAAFKWILSGFIGLAVGTLTGSGIFHLIPMAFNIPDLDIYHTYLNKALIPMLLIYIYYMRDQLLRIFLNIETIVCTHSHAEGDVLTELHCHAGSSPSILNDSKRLSFSLATETVFDQTHSSGLIENLRKMKAAGWMIFIGDMLHNFIDGLTLGAAFMVSIGEGLRMSLPIICEEFPHELGDIAVLLSSGLTIGQALIMNFLSACSCYLGFIIGAKLGELEQVHPWIYALAGGMFVYIGLADMIPELVAMGDKIEKDHIDAKKPITTVLKLKILLCQNSGLILGFVIMFLLGKYSEYLENLVKL